MSKFHKKEDIESMEEHWQKQCYFKSGDGIHYIHCCEICHRTSEEPKRIPGGHYLCSSCLKELKLLKEKTIIKKGKAFIEASKKYKFLPNEHPAEPAKKERQEAWKKIIRNDYFISVSNKNFNYDEIK
tara:strand:+ start:894 stop:1277 length:384 start_codon:yes stop_codon:yes gene_type:complete